MHRDPPSGCEALRVHVGKGEPKPVEPFVTGLLSKGGPSGRSRSAPSFGLAVAPDGSLDLGDDQHGIIDPIRYAG